MNVTLRKRPISGGKRYSLFLDFTPPIKHPDTGKPIRFYSLGLYIQAKPADAHQRKENRKTMDLAESTRSRIYMAIMEDDYFFLSSSKKPQTIGFYMRSLMEQRKGSTAAAWDVAIRALVKYGMADTGLSDITPSILQQYRGYLLDNYSRNTAAGYFAILRSALNQAYRDELIKTNPTHKVKSISRERTRREFLTYEELGILAKTPCQKIDIKRAFLFSAFTGLRFSDIEQLHWEDLHETSEGISIHFQQKKTGEILYHPISEDAYKLLGPKGKGLVFPKLRYKIYHTHTKTAKKNLFRLWIDSAGINRRITFHTARHTYAVLQLSVGTPIEVVRDLLGHAQLSTTEIYAHIVDKSRREAANKLNIPQINLSN